MYKKVHSILRLRSLRKVDQFTLQKVTSHGRQNLHGFQIDKIRLRRSTSVADKAEGSNCTILLLSRQARSTNEVNNSHSNPNNTDNMNQSSRIQPIMTMINLKASIKQGRSAQRLKKGCRRGIHNWSKLTFKAWLKHPVSTDDSYPLSYHHESWFKWGANESIHWISKTIENDTGRSNRTNCMV
jgi:hypothetical protein